jgi:hypothetical protein
MLASRSVVSRLLRGLGDFSLHPQGRPAGGRLRRPSSRRQRHDSHRGPGLTLTQGANPRHAGRRRFSPGRQKGRSPSCLDSCRVRYLLASCWS